VAAAAVVVEAGFTRHRAQDGAVGAPHHLGVVLLVGPAAGHDGVAVLHVHRVVVVAPGVFAPRQRAPGAVGGPGGHAVAVVPAARAAVARRVAHLVHALGPRAPRGLGRDRAHDPGLVRGELEAVAGLVGPVLAPVLGHVPAARVDQDVLEHDPAWRAVGTRAVLHHDHGLAAAAALRGRAFVAGRQQHGLVEGEI